MLVEGTPGALVLVASRELLTAPGVVLGAGSLPTLSVWQRYVLT